MTLFIGVSSLTAMGPLALLLLLTTTVIVAKYEPNWQSIDSRPLPGWYDDVKFGIFCHWGLYSVPAYRSEWFWWYWQGAKPDPNVVDYMKKNYKPGTTYADFTKDFTAELFDPVEFVNVVKSAGAKYFVLTSKHHEGYTMWPSRHSWNWNSVDTGPKRDLVGELKAAFSKSDIHFGLYFSQFEWFHPLFLRDSKGNSTEYVQTVSYPQMIDIVETYKPDVIWSDGDWGMTDDYWKSKEFLAWLYNDSPVKDQIVVNDRWGKDTMGKHGGFLTYEDHYDPGKLLERKWENCMTLDTKSWGNRRNMLLEDVQQVHALVEQLARTISCGGNLLLNVGPDNHGRIPLIFQERLKELGTFLGSVSEAIYGTRPWIHQNDTNNVWYTSRYRKLPHDNKIHLNQYNDETIIYAWVLNVDGKDIPLANVQPTAQTKISILGANTQTNFQVDRTANSLVIPADKIPWRNVPRDDVLVFKIEYAQSQKIPHDLLKNLRKQAERHRSLASFVDQPARALINALN